MLWLNAVAKDRLGDRSEIRRFPDLIDWSDW